MKKIYGILCVLFCFFWAGCEEDSVVEGTGFDIVERNANFTAAGGELTVTLSVEGDKVQSDQDWCTASISGKIVTVSLETNLALEGRTAKITVTRGTEKISFPVTQGGNRAPTAEVEDVIFDANGGTQEISVEHVTPFTAVSGAAWLTARVDGSTLILTTSTNYSIDEISTTVKLISGDLESEITVTQTGISLVPEKTDLAMSNAGDEATIVVKSTLPFTAVSNADWLTVTSDDNSVTLKASNNSGQPLRIAKVTLTSETLIATINVVQSLYPDYIGKWTLTGMDGATPFTYNISIEQATVNSTYKLTGWGKSVVATDSKYAIRANFDAATGLIYITAQENIGVFSDSEGEYDVMFYGYIAYGNGYSLVRGNGYICYVGMLQPDGTVQWGNGSVTIGDGTTHDVVGAMYRIIDKADGKNYAFNVDSPYMRMPIMKKVTPSSTAPLATSIYRMDNTKTVVKSLFHAQY